MNDLKNKSTQELIDEARKLAEEHERLKGVILKMLDELDLIERKQEEIIKMVQQR